MEKIPLFYPNVPKSAIIEVCEVLQSKFIGQGPKVELFEKKFCRKFAPDSYCVATGSGTDALHLAYILAGIKENDEVICPIFTCTATNIPLLYLKAKLVFADVQADTLNIDPKDVKRKITDRTKAIVCVHYGGLPCDMDELNSFGLPVIQDSAHALGATYKGKPITELSDFSMFSFQAIKNLTTGDGGMLVLRQAQLVEAAKRIRWFGIDREAKLQGIWENDIWELGYKYQMTDIAAAIGLAGLEEYDSILKYRRQLFQAYNEGLKGVSGITSIGVNKLNREHACWIYTVKVERRKDLQKKLGEKGIASDQVHYRNDRYTVFGGRQAGFPNMDAIEDHYLVLPLHTKMTLGDVATVCSVIRKGW